MEKYFMPKMDDGKKNNPEELAKILEQKEHEIALLEQENKKLQQENSELEAENTKYSEYIQTQNKEIMSLREYKISAEKELNSEAFRFALKIRNLVADILPVGSKRKTALSFIAKGIGKGGRAEKEKTVFGSNSDVSSFPIDIKRGNDQVEEYEELYFTQYECPLVSIVIPLSCQAAYIYRCLRSILKNSRGVPYEVIVVVDEAGDFRDNLESKIYNILKIENNIRCDYLGCCKVAAEQAKGKYILFLQDNIQVQADWLKSLLDLMEGVPLAGIVGPKIVRKDGHLQSAGGIAWQNGTVESYGDGNNPAEAEFNYVKEVDFVSSKCMMVKKEFWNKEGGFNEEFSSSHYRDADFAFEARKSGYKVLYQPLAIVVQLEDDQNTLNETEEPHELGECQQQNREKFCYKWTQVLEEENVSSEDGNFLARDRSRRKKHILVVDHYIPQFDRDAGGRGTFMYLKLFKALGLQVAFIGDNFFKHEPYATMLNQEGIEILYGEYYAENYQKWLEVNGKYFDYIYLQRPHIALKYIDVVRQYSNAKIIYYDVDLCHVREMRQYEITKDAELLKSAKRWKKMEFGLVKKADVVHVVGSYEEEYLRKFFPDKPIRNIPLYIYDGIRKNVNKDFSKKKDLLFVGGFGHPPNEDAVLWFAENVFPAILEKYPTIKWHIVGAKPPVSIQNLANENILVRGFVSEEELVHLYNKCKLDVVPLRYGAGVKGKVLEAIYNRIPLVTTSIGAEGLSRDEDAYWVVDGAVEMAQLIMSIYENDKLLLEKYENCEHFIENHFTRKEAEHVLKLDMEI